VLVPLLAFAAAGGALLSLALRTARKLVRIAAPRLVSRVALVLHSGTPALSAPPLRIPRVTRGRAPPALA
jgi:hypothetical protein